MSGYVLLQLKGHYLSLQEDEQTIELSEDRDLATAFPVEVIPELEAAFAEHGIEETFTQVPLSEDELAAMGEEEEADA